MLKVPTVTSEQIAKGYIGYMPSMDEVPERFKDWNSNDLYLDFVSEWFFNGVDPLRLTPRDDISRLEVIPLIKNVLGSREPKHEHKIAALAYMLYSWFYVDGYETKYPLTFDTLNRYYKKWGDNTAQKIPGFLKIEDSFGKYFCDLMHLTFEEDFLKGRDMRLETLTGSVAYRIISEYIYYWQGDIIKSECSPMDAGYILTVRPPEDTLPYPVVYWHRYKRAALKHAKLLKDKGHKGKVEKL